jgi:alpha-mannosidase
LTYQRDGAAITVPDAIAEGAGVGFGVEEFKLSQVSRGGGKDRAFHIFNPSPWSRSQPVELVLWDWEGSLERMSFSDVDGNALRYQLVDHNWKDYWGHRYLRLLVEAEVPSCGYTTVKLTETDKILDFELVSPGPRTEHPEKLVLENEHLYAEFDRQSCALVLLVNKADGRELVNAQRPAHFRHILEDDRAGMTAWIVGRYMQVQELIEGVRLLKLETDSLLKQSLTYEVRFHNSKLTVTVSLDAGSQQLVYQATCDWHEIGRPGEGIPQLNFSLPVAYACRGYRYDIPFGTVDREPFDQDVPAISWALALAKDNDGPKVQLITSSTYGFRGVSDSLSLDLIRSSYDPDPYPELGIHQIQFAIQVVDGLTNNHSLIANAFDFNHPLDVTSGKGNHISSASFLNLESGSVAISAIKVPEDGGEYELIVRLYETDGQETAAKLRFAFPVVSAGWVDTHEEAVDSDAQLQIDGSRLAFTMKANQLAAIRVKLSV